MAIEIDERILQPAFNTLQRKILRNLADVTSTETINDIAANPSVIQLELDDLTDVVAPSPANGDIIRFDGTDWESVEQSPALSVTTGRNLTPTDSWAFINVASGIGNVTLTLTDNPAWPDGVEIRVCRSTLFTVTIGTGGGVTLNYPSDKLPKARAQNSVVLLRKIGAADWVIYGDLEDAP